MPTSIIQKKIEFLSQWSCTERVSASCILIVLKPMRWMGWAMVATSVFPGVTSLVIQWPTSVQVYTCIPSCVYSTTHEVGCSNMESSLFQTSECRCTTEKEWKSSISTPLCAGVLQSFTPCKITFEKWEKFPMQNVQYRYTVCDNWHADCTAHKLHLHAPVGYSWRILWIPVWKTK